MKSNSIVDKALAKGIDKLASLPKSGPARTAYLQQVVAEVFKEVGLKPPVIPKRLAIAA